MSDGDSGPNSVLTKKQREWLRGDEDALGSAPRTIRMRVRNRFRQSIKDLALVHQSDRIDSEDMMKSIRESNTISNDDVSEAVAAEGELDEEIIEEALDFVSLLYEAFTGEEIDNNGRLEPLDDDDLPVLAVYGAFKSLQTGADKTEKQSRQWIEHHWPEPDAALSHLERSRERWDSENRDTLMRTLRR